MHYFVAMKIAKTYEDLSSNKLCFFFAKPFLVAKVIEQISSTDKLEEKVDSQIVLKDIVHV
jgi:hypothetical protein